MYEIDKGIAIPDPRTNGCIYPWDDMEIGDSFIVPPEKDKSIHATKSAAGKRYGKKFIARKVDGGTRVWRVE